MCSFSLFCGRDGHGSGVEAVPQSVCSGFYHPEQLARQQQVKQGVSRVCGVSDYPACLLFKSAGKDVVQPWELHPNNDLGLHHTMLIYLLASVQLEYHINTKT